MHPLVRWQYRGGIPEHRRKAFLFTNTTDAKGRRYPDARVASKLGSYRKAAPFWLIRRTRPG